LGSWLDARAHQGKWLLRIEDVDVPRSLPGATATILHQLGFNHEQLTYRFQGRDFRLTDVHGKVVQDILA
jgi:glutamyl/glutaminyl-tRNA synthetase